MPKKIFFILFIISSFHLYAQESQSKFTIGLNYGIGNQTRDKDYSYTSQFIRGQIYYRLKTKNKYQIDLLVQPEINFGKHQLLNLYFVQPTEPNYIEKREEYTQLKNINLYAMNVGILYRKPLSKSIAIYGLVNVGPLYIDTQTERLADGFAFSDVIALGVTFKTKEVIFDLRPSLRHLSNADTQFPNSGLNQKNIEFGFAFNLN